MQHCRFHDIIITPSLTVDDLSPSPTGLSSAQGLSGQDVGARPSSEGHSQRDPQTSVPGEGGSAVLHRPSDETEQDEMRHVTLKTSRAGRQHAQVQMEQNTPAHMEVARGGSWVTDQRSVLWVTCSERRQVSGCSRCAGVFSFSYVNH